MNRSRIGYYLAAAAIGVNAPRLALAYLEANGLPAPAWRPAALLVTAVATGVVLTGGLAWVGHVAASTQHLRRTLAVLGVVTLAMAAVLATPLLVAGLAGEPMADVLAGDAAHWAWSLVAVLCGELVAVAAVVAQVAADRERTGAQGDADEVLALARERDQLAQRLRSAEHAAATASQACACGWPSQQALAAHLRRCPQHDQKGAK